MLFRSGQSQASLSNVQNTGNITIGTKTNDTIEFKYYAIFGGVVGEFNAGTYTVNKVSNTGNIDINIKYTTTDNYQTTAYGALIGLANRTLTLTDCYNTGNITIGEKYYNDKTHMSVGGFFGVLNGTLSLTNCYNRGTVKVEAGAAVKKDQHVGGLAGFINKAVTIDATNGFRNIGTVEAYNNSTVTGKNYVGGVGGNVSGSVKQAQVFCDVVAPGATQVGMIVGASRGSSQAQNCKLGGKIAKSLNSDGTPNFKTVWRSNSKGGEVDPETGEELGEDPNAPKGEIVPFWDVIYGGTWSGASATSCDGCSYIGSITIQ